MDASASPTAGPRSARLNSRQDQSGLPGYEVLDAAGARIPLVLASPHSGAEYPAAFTAASRLDALALRRSEDSFVDEIFGAAPELGAPMLRALFPRAYVDANREPYELDPDMFSGDLPSYANTSSPRVAAGLGTIARVVASGEPIYGEPIPVREALRRIETCYRPYHAALRALVHDTKDQFGYCILLDCHSMPSVGSPQRAGNQGGKVDIVLGDCHGTSCDSRVIAAAERRLIRAGYSVVRNTPYAGGYTTRHYGAPSHGVHALQIEINRSLYMNEDRIERHGGIRPLRTEMAWLIRALGAISLAG